MGEGREAAAGVEGDEVVGEEGGGGDREMAGLEEVAVELLPFWEVAGGGEGDDEGGEC